MVSFLWVPNRNDGLEGLIGVSMATELTVNELVDRITELHGTLVEVIGRLSFEFENQALWHFPEAEQRPAPESGPVFCEIVPYSIERR